MLKLLIHFINNNLLTDIVNLPTSSAVLQVERFVVGDRLASH